jgi:hypothetical protein
MSRGAFKFDSNKLDNIGRYLKEGRKLPNTGSALWKSVCEEHDLKAWKEMRRYCKQDTVLLASVYERIKPWAKNHPNMGMYRAVRDRPPGIPCPTCESSNTQRRGIAVKLSTRRHRFQCQDCGAWFSGKPL